MEISPPFACMNLLECTPAHQTTKRIYAPLHTLSQMRLLHQIGC